MKPGGTRWDETGCSVDAWNPFQTQWETCFSVQCGQGFKLLVCEVGVGKVRMSRIVLVSPFF